MKRALLVFFGVLIAIPVFVGVALGPPALFLHYVVGLAWDDNSTTANVWACGVTLFWMALLCAALAVRADS